MNAEEIQRGIETIENVLRKGGYLASNSQPCAALAYYDQDADSGMPWRISDDGASECFATLEEAIDGAEAWCEEVRYWRRKAGIAE